MKLSKLTFFSLFAYFLLLNHACSESLTCATEGCSSGEPTEGLEILVNEPESLDVVAKTTDPTSPDNPSQNESIEEAIESALERLRQLEEEIAEQKQDLNVVEEDIAVLFSSKRR